MRIPTVAILAIVLALCGATIARAQQPNKACTDAAYRQFDFWLGDWDVLLPDGKPAGHNHIVSIAGGCGLEEQWTGAGGGTGRSLNTYDAAERRWRQFWVGGDGTVLQLAGGLAGNVMTLENAANRIRFTRNADRTVRQQWDASTDGGKTWKTVFDGKYVRSGGASGAAASSARDRLSTLIKADSAGGRPHSAAAASTATAPSTRVSAAAMRTSRQGS
jgi:hypothetical protein